MQLPVDIHCCFYDFMVYFSFLTAGLGGLCDRSACPFLYVSVDTAREATLRSRCLFYGVRCVLLFSTSSIIWSHIDLGQSFRCAIVVFL
jgi:hypothetical protein